MKKSFIILVNIMAILVVFNAIEHKIYNDSTKDFYERITERKPNKFEYLKKPLYGLNIENFFVGGNNEFGGRAPDGLEYNSTPITIFGCSYAFGQFLPPEATFSYKLAHLLKRPVYNRAIPSKGLAKMLYQSESDSFYNDVPPSDTVIYIMLNDHYRRMKLSFIEISDAYMHITYKKKGDKLIREDFNSPIKCFLNSTYLNKYIKKHWAHHYMNNPKFADKITDEVLLYFIETRKNLEARWNTKVNFVVIFYDSWLFHQDLLKEKLEKNNFKVIKMQELTNENLYTDKYYSPQTLHPTETTWNLLTPKIVDFLKLNKENIKQ